LAVRDGFGAKRDCKSVLLDRDAVDHLVDNVPVPDTVSTAIAVTIPMPVTRLTDVTAKPRARVRASGFAGAAIDGGRHSVSAIVRKKVGQSIENGPFHIRRGNAGDGSGFALPPFRGGSRDIVAIAHPVLYREARGHAVPMVVKQLSDQESLRSGALVDRDMVAESQIRTVSQQFRDKVLPDAFPGRNEVPKTLIFAKDDSHADDIVRIAREVFAGATSSVRRSPTAPASLRSPRR
jgi:hypothetical protein